MAKMFAVTSNKGDSGTPTVVSIKGYLDSSTFGELQDFLESLLENKEKWLILDMTDLLYISAFGLGIILGVSKELREKKGDMVVFGMSTKIRNLFQMLGFEGIIKFFQTEAEAVEYFTGQEHTLRERIEEDDY